MTMLRDKAIAIQEHANNTAVKAIVVLRPILSTVIPSNSAPNGRHIVPKLADKNGGKK